MIGARAEAYWQQGFNKKKIERMLPKVGDKLKRKPKWSRADIVGRPSKLPCKVIYVNKEHGWYLVEYIGLGIREAFKIVDTECEEGGC